MDSDSPRQWPHPWRRIPFTGRRGSWTQAWEIRIVRTDSRRFNIIVALKLELFMIVLAFWGWVTPINTPESLVSNAECCAYRKPTVYQRRRVQMWSRRHFERLSSLSNPPGLSTHSAPIQQERFNSHKLTSLLGFTNAAQRILTCRIGGGCDGKFVYLVEYRISEGWGGTARTICCVGNDITR